MEDDKSFKIYFRNRINREMYFGGTLGCHYFYGFCDDRESKETEIKSKLNLETYSFIEVYDFSEAKVYVRPYQRKSLYTNDTPVSKTGKFVYIYKIKDLS
ncbi:MAG: hypothetical protein IPI23_01010 [Bacteroidetes bacterium]|nr:hypothetical protein [Bacteroidota bacterium]